MRDKAINGLANVSWKHTQNNFYSNCIGLFLLNILSSGFLSCNRKKGKVLQHNVVMQLQISHPAQLSSIWPITQHVILHLPLYETPGFHPWNRCDQRCHEQFLEWFPWAEGRAAFPADTKANGNLESLARAQERRKPCPHTPSSSGSLWLLLWGDLLHINAQKRWQNNSACYRSSLNGASISFVSSCHLPSMLSCRYLQCHSPTKDRGINTNERTDYSLLPPLKSDIWKHVRYKKY